MTDRGTRKTRFLFARYGNRMEEEKRNHLVANLSKRSLKE